MSASTTHVVEALLEAANYRSVIRSLDAIAVLLLLVLLVEGELIRTYTERGRRVDLRPLGVAILPLLLCFVLIVVVRATRLR